MAPQANDLLEDGALKAVVQVLGLEDPVVLLAVADLVTLGLTLEVKLLLLLLPFLLQLESPVLGQLVDGVRGLAVTEKRLLAGGEEGHLLADVGGLLLLLLLLLLLNAVGVDLILTGSSDVQLDLGEEGPLDVGDGLGLGGLDEEALDDAALQVDREGLLKVDLEVAGDLGALDVVLGLAALGQSASLGEVELAVDGEEAGVLELDAEAVVGEGLDADLGGEPQTGELGIADFGNSGQDLGLVPVDELPVGSPAVVVGGVAESNAHWKGENKL